MRERTRPVVAALSFLTAVPIGRGVGERDLTRGAALFPVIGAAVGAVAAVVAWGAAHVLPPFAAAVLGVASGVTATAALHLDGLGDVADGIGAALSGSDPAEAMRDPRLGAFGVAAVALDLLLKVSLLAALVGQGFPWAVVAAGALSRAAPIALAWRSPYAGGGAGAWLNAIGGRTAIATLLVALTVAVPSAGGPATGAMVAVAAVLVLVLSTWSKRHLGGFTGDVLGASAELGETLMLAAAIAAG